MTALDQLMAHSRSELQALDDAGLRKTERVISG